MLFECKYLKWGKNICVTIWMNQAIDISLIIELCEAFYFHSEVCQICNLGMQQTTSLSAN